MTKERYYGKVGLLSGPAAAAKGREYGSCVKTATGDGLVPPKASLFSSPAAISGKTYGSCNITSEFKDHRLPALLPTSPSVGGITLEEFANSNPAIQAQKETAQKKSV